MAYLRLLSIFYKNSLITELEYRLQFWANLGLSLFWLVWAALGVRVFFIHTATIAGWRYEEVLVVVGLFFALNGYRQMFIQPNLSRLSQYVQQGLLDYMLTRPVNSQFLVSLRYIGVHNWGDPLLGLGLVAYAFWLLGYAPGPVQVGQFLLLALAAVVLLYSLNLLLQTTTIWLVNIERADTLVWSLLEAGRFPVDFYRGWVRLALTVLVPVAFFTTFPAMALLGRLEWWVAAVALLVALLAFVAASAFWRFALRSYTSVSS
ncbi:MAG: ABC-2 family transporter protein [Chloroflexaceae bacterium]|jgi:ABC-2 type transport system permease protein|nr:ABC-2 family transporter protein [Chloroflexaceae bacterium]